VLEALGCVTQMAYWQRHDLLRVAPDAWRVAVSARQASVAAPLLEVWADRGWPVVVRRRMQGEKNGLPIGVPLPPSAGKLRIAMTIPGDAVISGSAPPFLQDVMQTAPTPNWQRLISALIRVGMQHDVQPLVFGSLMWQYQTGLSYIGPTSDLDVLWPVSDRCDVASLVSGIAGIEGHGMPRVDGEIIFSNGSGINWKELFNALRAGAPDRLLVKDMEGARLVDVAHALGRG
jgi:phosphoribosyl-dephospho-CoA transferase